ncbi:MAG: hypothetical protein ABJB10_01200 [Mesorhizobium sp.]
MHDFDRLFWGFVAFKVSFEGVKLVLKRHGTTPVVRRSRRGMNVLAYFEKEG